MKNAFLATTFILLWTCLVTPTTCLAQTRSSRAALIAESEAMEESFRLLSSSITALETAQAEQQRRLEAMGTEIQRLRAQTAQPRGDYVTREQLNAVVVQLKEIDQKRQADKDKILAEIRQLGKNLTKDLRTASLKATTSTQAPKFDGALEHEIQQDETLSAIVAAYNDHYQSEGKRTSLTLIEKANPGIKPTSLKIGQKVVIPLVKR